MSYANIDPAVMGWLHISNNLGRCEARRIAILLFDGFSLLGAGIVAEVFHVANELSSVEEINGLPYDVLFLSAEGGNVMCSSSLSVLTDRLDISHYLGFDALFIAGGKGAHIAANDERIIDWLQGVHAKTLTVKSIAEGRKVLDAAGIRGIQASKRSLSLGSGTIHSGFDEHDSESGDRYESMKIALVMIKRDHGLDVARRVAERLLPGSAKKLESFFGDSGVATTKDKIRIAARWLQDNCERAISMSEAAQVALMSERNFLRHFKIEMGITPSDYLLQVRLDVVCVLLTDSELPIDKIARRSGMGNGGRLAKIFRKHLLMSPTAYRTQRRESIAAPYAAVPCDFVDGQVGIGKQLATRIKAYL